MAIMHNPYMSLLLLPIGVLFFLLIKFSSDLGASKKTVTIYHGDTVKEETGGTGKGISAMEEAQKRNDGTFILKGLPVRICEMGYYGIDACFGGNIIVHNGMLCHGKGGCSYRGFIARQAYDEFMCNGNLAIKGSMGHDAFLSANGIVAYYDINAENLHVIKRLTIAVMNLAQRNSLGNRKTVFARGNALLLFRSVTGSLEVIEC